MKRLFEFQTVRLFFHYTIAFLTTFFIMMSFEFFNSLLFPFPNGMDYKNPEQLFEFTKSLPLIAFIIVLLGWIIGSTFGGIILTKRLQKNLIDPKKHLFLFSVILLFLGILNNFLFLSNIHPIWFHVFGLSSLFLLPQVFYDGNKFLRSKFEKIVDFIVSIFFFTKP